MKNEFFETYTFFKFSKIHQKRRSFFEAAHFAK